MSKNQNGAGSSENSGSANQNQQSDSDADNQESNESAEEQEFVPRKSYDGVTKDLHKWKNRAKETQAKMAAIEAELAEVKSKIEDGGDSKAQLERWKREAEESKAELAKTKSGLIYGEKYRAIYVELKKLGLLDEAERILEHEDLADIETELTSKGRINVLNAKEWAEDFYKRNQYAFQAKKAPKVNGTDGRGGDGGGSGEITPSMVVEAENKWKRSGKPEDEKAYRVILDNYLKQKKRRA